MKNTVVVDIDGTLTKVGDRLKYLKQSPKDWDSFYEACDEDAPQEDILSLVHKLSREYRITFCTGRRKSVYGKTKEWLKTYLWDDFPVHILMRGNDDKRHDTELKPELLKLADLYPENVAFILEDRNSMVKKFRELGYRVLQVAEGDF